MPTEGEIPAISTQSEHVPEHVIVNSLQEKMGREYDRDESAKQLITEDDIRGLDEGARVRVAENAKLTPLAQDIVNEKRLVLIRKQPRKSSVKVKSVAIGAGPRRISR